MDYLPEGTGPFIYQFELFSNVSWVSRNSLVGGNAPHYHTCGSAPGYSEPITSPTQLYRRIELKHLELYWCTFPSLVSFMGFPNLLSLELLFVNFHNGKIWEIIAGFPLVESLLK